jgi:hypothetical protein
LQLIDVARESHRSIIGAIHKRYEISFTPQFYAKTISASRRQSKHAERAQWRKGAAMCRVAAV